MYVRKRNNPEVIETLLDYSVSTEDENAAIAAIEATRFMASAEHLGYFLGVIENTQNNQIRKAAEANAEETIKKGKSKATMESAVAAAYEKTNDKVIKHTYLRLLGEIGGERALEIVKENLASSDLNDNTAAIIALENWADTSGFRILIDFLASSPEEKLRNRAFRAAITQATMAPSDKSEDFWTQLRLEARTRDEEMKVVRGLANVDPAPWVYASLDTVIEQSENSDTVDIAERAKKRLAEVEKIRGN